MSKPCIHAEVEPVVTSNGETVAHICCRCLGRLPAEWFTCNHATMPGFSAEHWIDFHHCGRCGASWAEKDLPLK